MIKYSLEELYHFHCEECNGWFSIGDFRFDKSGLFCPNCGWYGELRPAEKFIFLPTETYGED